MYTYDVENDISIFDGDFEGYLKDIGVDGEHIKKMQCKILQEDRDRYQDFPDLGSTERDYIQLVPLNKVIGTCRCTVGWSVYENVRKMYRGDREPERFQRCFGYLQELTLDELKESYQKLYNPVKMVYYVDDDEYYLSGDGNHRTLTAMLVGAEKIKARVTNAYCNPLKKRKCEYARMFEQKYGIYRIMRSGSRYDITYKDENGYYEIRGYQGLYKNEDLFLFIDRLSRTIEEENEKAEKIKRLPSVLQNLVLKLQKNDRLKKYINKNYLSEKELTFWNYREPVYLDIL